MKFVTFSLNPILLRSSLRSVELWWMQVRQFQVVCFEFVFTRFHRGFFKRSVRRNLNYRCKMNNDCQVNVNTRNQCQSCRYKRCLNGESYSSWHKVIQLSFQSKCDLKVTVINRIAFHFDLFHSAPNQLSKMSVLQQISLASSLPSRTKPTHVWTKR